MADGPTRGTRPAPVVRPPEPTREQVDEARSLAIDLAEAAHRYLIAPKGEAQFLSKEERTEKADAFACLSVVCRRAREAGLLGEGT